ncbi:MFS transporter [Paenibacillus kandeliae]|uniref:MFS transporter n=1 Tax=Paenibacillus kandeliae TaxID=3231269 RepID=UPI00345AD4EC
MKLWKNRPFVYLFLARFVALIGDGLLFLALLKMLELQQTGSIGLSFYYLAAGIPAFLFAIPAGAVVEKSNLQKTMIITDLTRALLIVIFIVMQIYGWQHPALIYTLLFVITINDMFFLPASQSLLRWIVPEELRPSANGQLQMAMMTGKLLSYSMGAFLIKQGMSLSMLLVVTIATFLCSASIVLRIRPYIVNHSNQTAKTLQLAVEGVRFIQRTPVIRSIFIIFGLAWLVGSSIDIFLISYLNQILHMGTENLYLISIFSLCGIVIGSLLAPWCYKTINKKIGFCLPSLIFGLVFVAYAMQLPLPVLLVSLMIGGIAQGIFITFVNSYLQEITSQDYYARISSFYTLLMQGASLPGFFLIGVLIERTGVLYTGYMIGLYMILLAVFSLFILPSLQKQKEEQTDIALPVHPLQDEYSVSNR